MQTRLGQIDWGPLEVLSKTDVTAAHSLFIDTILPIIEELVPCKLTGKRFGRRRVDKRRRCIWRKLAKIRRTLLSTFSVSKATSLLKSQQLLEKELKSSYDLQGREEEDKVVNAMKTNIKAFFAYGKSRQKTKAKVGPFLDPDTGIPNPDPDYAASILIEQ